MDTSENKNPTPSLKSRITRRASFLVLGGIVLFGLFAMAGAVAAKRVDNAQVMAVPQPDKTSAEAAAKLKGSSVEVMPNGNLKAQPEESSADGAAKPTVVFVPAENRGATLILPAIALGIFGLLVYAVYDLLRLYLRYRISKERDDVMFP